MTTISKEGREIVARLKKLSTQKERLAGKTQAINEEINKLVVEGDAAGVPKLTLGAAAGMARQTVYIVLLRAEAGR